MREAIGFSPATTPLARDYEMCAGLRRVGSTGTTRLTRLSNFFRKVSLAGPGIEPVGFRVKSDLRNHQAIVQPRLYDSLMVTQITLPRLSRYDCLMVTQITLYRSSAGMSL